MKILNEKISSDISVASRCQLMKLCKALEANIDGEVVQFELIFRNYLTGSLFQALQDGKDPYGLDLPSNLKEWHKFETPLFTPTTKGLRDEPLNSKKVRDTFPEIISSLEKLFKDFTTFAEDRGIVVVDTKFEIFVDEDEPFFAIGLHLRNRERQWLDGVDRLAHANSRNGCANRHIFDF